MHASMHAHTKCFADNSLPFDDTPDTERPRTELKLWQEKRAESRHLLPPASVAPIKRQGDASLALCDVRRTEAPSANGLHDHPGKEGFGWKRSGDK